MSQITRCPNCATTFRVSDAQLAAFQGKVRCGKCAFVFHAPDNLVQPETDLPPATITPPAASPQPDIPPASLAEPATRVEPVLARMYPQTDTREAVNEEIIIEIPPMTLAPETFKPAEAAIQPVAQDTPAVQTASPDDYQPIALEDDDFLAPQKAASAWWILPVILMVILLIVQIIYAARTRITMELPGLRPQFVAACQIIGCDVPLPRRSELLRSEWSELTYVPGQPNLIQVSATLRNLASFGQALPLLQLSLTDEQENIVARRIFRPEQYLTATERTRTQLAAGDELHAYLQLDLGNLHSTGYSLFWVHE